MQNTGTAYLRCDRSGRKLLRVLKEPFFPLESIVRNVHLLAKEPGWRESPVRLRKQRLADLLRERAAFFLEVKRRSGAHPEWSGGEPPDGYEDPDEYCDRCGGCCETAHVLADFPESSGVPERWREIAGSGLGADHRFCPFLWEQRRGGGAFCSVYAVRPLPCRRFEKEECEFLKADREFLRLRRQAASRRLLVAPAKRSGSGCPRVRRSRRSGIRVAGRERSRGRRHR